MAAFIDSIDPKQTRKYFDAKIISILEICFPRLTLEDSFIISEVIMWSSSSSSRRINHLMYEAHYWVLVEF